MNVEFEFFFSIVFIHVGTIYNSETIFYCAPERKLSVWTEQFFYTNLGLSVIAFSQYNILKWTEIIENNCIGEEGRQIIKGKYFKFLKPSPPIMNFISNSLLLYFITFYWTEML